MKSKEAKFDFFLLFITFSLCSTNSLVDFKGTTRVDQGQDHKRKRQRFLTRTYLPTTYLPIRLSTYPLLPLLPEGRASCRRKGGQYTPVSNSHGMDAHYALEIHYCCM